MTADYTWEVYCLLDSPGGKVRYVGVSRDAFNRFKQHRKAARRGSTAPVHQWLRDMWDLRDWLGIETNPTCQVLESGVGIESAGLSERKWIQHWRDVSRQHGDAYPLLNRGDGGEFLTDVEAFKRRLTYRPANHGDTL